MDTEPTNDRIDSPDDRRGSDDTDTRPPNAAGRSGRPAAPDRRPLIVTADLELLDELLPLAAAGCGDVQVAGDALAARPHWLSASMVVVGADAARGCLRARLPHRRNVVLIAAHGGSPDDDPIDDDAADNDAADNDAAGNGAADNGAPADPATGGRRRRVAAPGGADRVVADPSDPVDAGCRADRLPDDDSAWRAAGALGADHVVVLPAAAAWLTERFGTAGIAHTAHAPVVGVVGGRGGVGASVLAAALAGAAARSGRRTMLVDADPLSGGVDLLLGWEDLAGPRWPELAGARGRIDVSALYGQLPGSADRHRGRLVVLSWDRGDVLELPAEAMSATLDAGRRGGDLVVVDLPRHLDDAVVRALQHCDLVLVVVPADVRGCAAAARIATQVGPHCAAVQLIVRGPSPGRLRAVDIERALGLPVAGSLRPEPDLAEALEHGESPTTRQRGPLAALCARLLAVPALTGTDRGAA